MKQISVKNKPEQWGAGQPQHANNGFPHRDNDYKPLFVQIEEASLAQERAVDNPPHYKVFPDMEAIDVIRKTLTTEEFRGYCKGNSLKYRLRAGQKDDTMQDIAKAEKYEEWLTNEY